MITEIGGKNFKGLEFRQPIGQKTILIGPNGSGKTARIQALTLAAIGYIPGGSSKTNAQILDTYSEANKLFVSFKVGKTEFHRRFSPNAKGSVSQDFLMDSRKISKDDFLVAMAKAGVPKILDLPEFLKMSDQKKINRIFELFPPSGDIEDLDEQIQILDDKIKAKQADMSINEKLIAKLAESKTAIPGGTLAELKKQIEETETQYKEVAKKLETAKIEKAQADAKAKAEKEAEEKAAKLVTDNAAKKVNEAIEAAINASKQPKEIGPESASITPQAKAAEDRLIKRAQNLGQGEFKRIESIVTSIQRILATINKVGCPACTAAMVAKRELKRYQNAEAEKF